jgi:AGZA family xanthine/uracil permease-like MFS transporter
VDHGHRAGRADADRRQGLQLPVPVIGELIEALQRAYLWTYLAVIVPMGIFNVVGSLQNIEAAEAAGDPYPTRPSLVVNGLGTVAAALFGSCFPTTIYIGHPGWKAMGARAGYSILSGCSRRSCASPARWRTSRGPCRSRPAWRSCCGSAS